MKKIISLLVLVLIVLVVLFVFLKDDVPLNDSQNRVFGSVQFGGEYQSTTTPTAGFTNLIALRSSRGTLGSIVVTASGSGSLTIYDATTSTNGAIYGTTTLARILPYTASSTYTFDSIARYGLLIEVAGTQPVVTITHR